MERNIKNENAIIDNIINEVIVMYVKEKLNNTGRGYTNFIENTLEPIVEKGYRFLDEEGLMGEFNKYVCQFGYSREDEKKASAIVDKFVKTYFKKVGSFIVKCENEINDSGITTLKGVMEYGKELLEKLNK